MVVLDAMHIIPTATVYDEEKNKQHMAPQILRQERIYINIYIQFQ